VQRMLSAFVACLAALMIGPLGSARAQNYPSKPIRLVVGFPAGGIVDTGARLLATELQKKLGQPIVVENIPGASGVIATQRVISSAPDGYTLLFHTISSVSKVFVKDLTIEPLSQLQPITPVWEIGSAVLIRSDLPVGNMKELIEYAKKHPGELNYAVPSASNGFIVARLKKEAAIDMMAIPYKGSAPSVIALLSGDVHFSFDVPLSYLPMIKEEKVRALMFSGKTRHAELPDTPTSVEAGFPDLQLAITNGFWASKGTPPVVAETINKAMKDILVLPHVQERFRAFGATADIASPEDFAERVAKEAKFWETAAALTGYEP
jgi:tripartite-type tricarboxylate transporter receptor subunit TctC